MYIKFLLKKQSNLKTKTEAFQHAYITLRLFDCYETLSIKSITFQQKHISRIQILTQAERVHNRQIYERFRD